MKSVWSLLQAMVRERSVETRAPLPPPRLARAHPHGGGACVLQKPGLLFHSGGGGERGGDLSAPADLPHFVALVGRERDDGDAAVLAFGAWVERGEGWRGLDAARAGVWIGGLHGVGVVAVDGEREGALVDELREVWRARVRRADCGAYVLCEEAHAAVLRVVLVADWARLAWRGMRGRGGGECEHAAAVLPAA